MGFVVVVEEVVVVGVVELVVVGFVVVVEEVVVVGVVVEEVVVVGLVVVDVVVDGVVVEVVVGAGVVGTITAEPRCSAIRSELSDVMTDDVMTHISLMY